MDRTSAGLLALGLFLVLLPATAFDPGLPATLKADEPAYWLAAESLVHDLDLRVEERDLSRLFQSYPYFPVHNLIVASDDGWQTLFYGKPWIYSLFAAPLVALFGAEGMVMTNALLFVAMIAMGVSWLRLHGNSAWLARLFAVGFFFGSVAWIYVYWLHPEIFNMATGMACLYFGLGALARGGDSGRAAGFSGDWLARAAGSRWALPISAAALALGTYNKPMLAALGLPVCLELLRHRRWRGLGTWLASAALTIGLCAVGSWLFTGHPTAYLVELRAGFTVHDPYRSPTEALPAIVFPTEPEGGTGAESEAEDEEDDEDGWDAGWWWLLRMPDTKGFELAEDLRYFFWGRHTGLFPYQPFALVCLILFAVHGLRRVEGWWVLGATALVALFFLLFIPFNWHGGGGFVGNRYFVMIYPAFLFLVTRVRPDWIVVPGWAAAGLFLGPLIVSPWGLVVPQGTLQAHVRGAAFQAFPVDFSLKEIPGYHGVVQSDVWVWARKDQVRVAPARQGSDAPLETWVRGGDRVDVFLHSDAPLERVEIELESPVDGQIVDLALGDERRRVTFEKNVRRLVIEPGTPHQVRRDRRPEAPEEFLDLWVYRLRLWPHRGERPEWSGRPGPPFPAGVILRLVEAEKGDAEAREAEKAAGLDEAAGET